MRVTAIFAWLFVVCIYNGAWGKECAFDFHCPRGYWCKWNWKILPGKCIKESAEKCLSKSGGQKGPGEDCKIDAKNCCSKWQDKTGDVFALTCWVGTSGFPPHCI